VRGKDTADRAGASPSGGISSTLSLTDTAGNTFAATGNTVTLDRDIGDTAARHRAVRQAAQVRRVGAGPRRQSDRHRRAALDKARLSVSLPVSAKIGLPGASAFAAAGNTVTLDRDSGDTAALSIGDTDTGSALADRAPKGRVERTAAPAPGKERVEQTAAEAPRKDQAEPRHLQKARTGKHSRNGPTAPPTGLSVIPATSQFATLLFPAIPLAPPCSLLREESRSPPNSLRHKDFQPRTRSALPAFRQNLPANRKLQGGEPVSASTPTWCSARRSLTPMRSPSFVPRASGRPDRVLNDAQIASIRVKQHGQWGRGPRYQQSACAREEA
jgi:hypothetical protein